MLNENLIIGMKVKMLRTCNNRGKTNSPYLDNYRNAIGFVKGHEQGCVYILDNIGGNYIIGENVELLELPTKESYNKYRKKD